MSILIQVQIQKKKKADILDCENTWPLFGKTNNSVITCSNQDIKQNKEGRNEERHVKITEAGSASGMIYRRALWTCFPNWWKLFKNIIYII